MVARRRVIWQAFRRMNLSVQRRTAHQRMRRNVGVLESGVLSSLTAVERVNISLRRRATLIIKLGRSSSRPISLWLAHCRTWSISSMGKLMVSASVSGFAAGPDSARPRAGRPAQLFDATSSPSLTFQDPWYPLLNFGLRRLGQAEITHDCTVVSEHHVALVRRPDGEAAAASDVGELFARQLRRLPVQLKLTWRFRTHRYRSPFPHVPVGLPPLPVFDSGGNTHCGGPPLCRLWIVGVFAQPAKRRCPAALRPPAVGYPSQYSPHP